MHIYMYTCICICIYAYIYMYMHVFVNICMYVAETHLCNPYTIFEYAIAAFIVCFQLHHINHTPFSHVWMTNWHLCSCFHSHHMHHTCRRTCILTSSSLLWLRAYIHASVSCIGQAQMHIHTHIHAGSVAVSTWSRIFMGALQLHSSCAWQCWENGGDWEAWRRPHCACPRQQ